MAGALPLPVEPARAAEAVGTVGDGRPDPFSSGAPGAVTRLRVEALEQAYGRRPALRGVSLSLGNGVTGLLGPNGAGKSSLMKCVAGILRWRSGTIEIDGVDAGLHPARVRRLVGYVPERAGFLSEMRVEQLLRFAAEAKGLPRSHRRDAVDQVIELAGLGEARRRIAGNLSKGYRQRVGIAQALLGEPSLLILDEPTSGLDPTSLAELYEFLVSYGENHAVLISTHVLADVRAVCARVVVIGDGRILADGPTRELSGSEGRHRYRFRLEGQAPSDGRLFTIVHLAGGELVRSTPVGGDLDLLVDVATPGAAADVNQAFVAAGRRVVSIEPHSDGLGALFEAAVAHQTQVSDGRTR